MEKRLQHLSRKKFGTKNPRIRWPGLGNRTNTMHKDFLGRLRKRAEQIRCVDLLFEWPVVEKSFCTIDIEKTIFQWPRKQNIEGNYRHGHERLQNSEADEYICPNNSL